MRLYSIFGFILISNLVLAQWETKITMGLSYLSGNINKFDTRNSIDITRKDSLVESNLYIKFIYSETNHLKENEEFAGGIKFDYKPYNKISPFLLISGFRNQFKHIDLRISGLIGLKYTIYTKKSEGSKNKSDYSISAALQYDLEKYTSQMDVEGNYTKKPDKDKLRISFRPRIKQQLIPNIYFVTTLFYRPSILDFEDYTFESITSVSSQITKKIDLGLSYQYDYMSDKARPDDAVKSVDNVFLMQLAIKF